MCAIQYAIALLELCECSQFLLRIWSATIRYIKRLNQLTSIHPTASFFTIFETLYTFLFGDMSAPCFYHPIRRKMNTIKMPHRIGKPIASVCEFINI